MNEIKIGDYVVTTSNCAFSHHTVTVPARVAAISDGSVLCDYAGTSLETDNNLHNSNGRLKKHTGWWIELYNLKVVSPTEILYTIGSSIINSLENELNRISRPGIGSRPFTIEESYSIIYNTTTSSNTTKQLTESERAYADGVNHEKYYWCYYYKSWRCRNCDEPYYYECECDPYEDVFEDCHS